MTKRIVVWGTGFVGKMVIAEVVKHPLFELVGVGVSNPDKVGRDVGEICGLAAPLGLTATDDVDALIDLKPDALVHYGPTAAHADANIALITRFLRAGIDVCSTAMTPWVWPTMHLNPPNWIAAHHRGMRARRILVLHHRHRSRLRERPVSDDADGPVLGGAQGARVRAAGLHQLLGRLRARDGHRQAAGAPGDVRDARHPRLRLGRNGSDDRACGGHHARRDHHHVRQMGDAHRAQDRPRASFAPGNVAAVRFTINGVYQGETRIQLEHVNRIGDDAAPDWPSGNENDVYRVDIEGTPSIFQETAFRFTDGSGRDAAAAGCLATGMRALNAVPAVNDLSPGWVTPLDLPLIAGVGTIR